VWSFTLNKKKVLFLSLVVIVFIFIEALVARQFMGDLRLRQGKAVLAETEKGADSSGDGLLSGYLLAEEYFKKALFWDDGNADSHYWISRLYQILTHRYARQEGRWDERAGCFVDGEKSKYYGSFAIEELYRAIDINPACQYFHLELAWLLRSKLATISMTAEEMLDRKGRFSRAPLSVYNTFREFKIATDLAPNRTMHHLSFGDFIVDRLVSAGKKGDIEGRVRESYERLLKEAVREYGAALALTPARIKDVLRSLTKVTIDYDVLRSVIPEDNRGLKSFVFYLTEVGEEDDVFAAFQRDMKARLASQNGSGDPAGTLFPYYDTLAGLYLKKKEYGEAATVLEEYLEYVPEDEQTLIKLADIRMKEKNFEKARIYLSHAVRLNPDNRSYRRKLVSVIVSGCDPTEAEFMLSDLAESFPEDPAVYEALGKNYENMGKREEAHTVYRKILEKTKDNALGYYLLGKLYEAEGKRDEAADFLKKAALLNGKYSRAFNDMFPLDVLLREYFESTRDYDRLKKLIPLTPESLNKLVLFLYNEGGWEMNRKAFLADKKRTEERFARLQAEGKPLKNVRSWLIAYCGTLSEIYEREGKNCRSIAVFKRLTELDPENHRAWFILARESTKHIKPCGYDRRFVEHAYGNALSGDPENSAYLKGYAGFLAEGGRLAEAEGIARKIVGLVPKDPEVHEILAGIYEKSGRMEEAAGELSEALSLSKGKKYYREKLSDLLKK
jgi:tetratricopeptide (TPR) repeat protein